MDKRLSNRLSSAHKYYTESKKKNLSTQLLLTQESGYLEPEEGEKTYQVTQTQLKELLPQYNSRLIFDLNLSLGGYNLDYTKNGSTLLLGGQKGHIALVNWRDCKLLKEFHTKEYTRDVKFLHNELLFAVAQRKAVYIYDNQGVEVQYLKNHKQAQKLEFLPYHFLLVSASNLGFLKYIDVSTGKPVAEHRFYFENVNDMKMNPWNAVINVADARGIVSMWTPNLNKPVVKLVAHNGPCRALDVDMRGLYMATAGADNKLKIFDIRKLGDSLHEYWTAAPATSISMSQKGLLGVGVLGELKVWKDWQLEKQKGPYMCHQLPSACVDMKFVPYEDFLGVGTTSGFSNLCVPGSGIANYDTYEANPFQTKKQRQEQEVHSLLEKLPPDTITYNPHELGTIDSASKEVIAAETEEQKPQPKKKKTQQGDETRRLRVQKEIRKKKQHVLEENEKMAKDIQFLETATKDLELPFKKAKTKEVA